MNNLWRRFDSRRSRSKSGSHKNANQSMPQEPEPEKIEIQNEPQGPEPERFDSEKNLRDRELCEEDELVLLALYSERPDSEVDLSALELCEEDALVLLERLDSEDVLRALELCEEDALGKGTFGTTYKVHLEGRHTQMVVKRLNDVVLLAEEFQGKIKVIGALDHENLLPLRGYFYSEHQKLLLYDYMHMGSLSDQLHRRRGWERTPLSWKVRLQIALGAARAIEYLHAQRRPEIHHGSIKSSNILLTPSYQARVSDYGLPRLTRPAPMGVADPSKVDVHDFGVLLLELLTGKPPTESLLDYGGQAVDLPTWVQSSVHEGRTAEVFDAELTQSFDIKQEMDELLLVAVSCLSLDSTMRPRMSEVRSKIEGLRGLRGQPYTDQVTDTR